MSHTGQTVARLRAGSDDADPTHGQNALCALVLEAMLESASGGVRVDELIADVQSARLADLAGDTDWALRMYRHFLVLFDGADASFDEELERIRNRVAELVAG